MSASIPGMITLAGLFAAYWMVIKPIGLKSVHLHVVQCYYALVGMFVWATILYNLKLEHDVMAAWYAMPLLCAMVWFLFIFRTSADRCTHVFALLFAVNGIGGMLGIDSFKMFVVDAMDLAVWLQIVLVIRLAQQRLDPILSKPYNVKANNNAMAEVYDIRRRFRSTTET